VGPQEEEYRNETRTDTQFTGEEIAYWFLRLMGASQSGIFCCIRREAADYGLMLMWSPFGFRISVPGQFASGVRNCRGKGPPAMLTHTAAKALYSDGT
jgi:hypothetical protein